MVCLALPTRTNGLVASELDGDDGPKPDAAAAKEPKDGDAPLADLADAVLSAGKRVLIITGMANYLDIPSDKDNWALKEVHVRGSGEDIRIIWVRRRSGSDRVDIILVSKVGTREYYYLTSPSGVLEKTAYKAKPKDSPRGMNIKEKKGFAEEVAFWKDWLSNRPKADDRKKHRPKPPTTSRPMKKPAEETP